MDKQAIRMKCLEMAMKFAETRVPANMYQQQIGAGQFLPVSTYNEQRLLEVAAKLEAYIGEPEKASAPKRKPAAKKARKR